MVVKEVRECELSHRSRYDPGGAQAESVAHNPALDLRGAT